MKSNATLPPKRPLPKYTVAAQQAISDHVQDLLTHGLIKRSSSYHYNIPAAIPKKNGSYRIVYDFRGANSITIPLPSTWRNFRELLQGSRGSTFFSTIDLLSAYHQLRVHPSTSKWTTFWTPLGKFQFKVLPFGLITAKVFGRYMTKLFSDMPFVRTYLDDILVFSTTAAQHYHHLKLVLERLSTNRHTVNWDKSVFAQKEIQMGWSCSQQG
ncbi:hypothetical protein LELG_05748 [Lodderomyces elongisporus NRRL YB-4239]|uniref:Reverse transcriptase domain-containing protein n=1 Tax=Lodderomyces elongisporus (strain ATCC 11503 / CBS 2605 / JCM 1781 / NBRC 1676 / NRRL YB-4239) TaxID=379508 RepID=A5E809_LODEL|nr:hypothetical protein LELG_05748 [Lodderomyces elongisporus NRRL YB-4239]